MHAQKHTTHMHTHPEALLVNICSSWLSSNNLFGTKITDLLLFSVAPSQQKKRVSSLQSLCLCMCVFRYCLSM